MPVLGSDDDESASRTVHRAANAALYLTGKKSAVARVLDPATKRGVTFRLKRPNGASHDEQSRRGMAQGDGNESSKRLDGFGVNVVVK